VRWHIGRHVLRHGYDAGDRRAAWRVYRR
jgi:hypothetical protein